MENLSRILHAHVPHLGGVNGGINSDLSTLVFKNEENLTISIAKFSYFNKKLTSLEKLSILKDFYSGI